ncbi:MAG: sugar phosphate isomerase/epimerase [Microbacterium sp.]
MSDADGPRLAVQLYTLRELVATDPDRALDAVVAAGYDSVELFGPVELLTALGDRLRPRGLSAPSLHARLVGTDPVPVFEAARSIGAGYVIDPRVDVARWGGRDDILRIADDLNELSVRAQAWDLAVGYHNHDVELAVTVDGEPALSVLAAALEPGVVLELDVYWAAIGGADVPRLLDDLGPRVRLLHVKDAPRLGDGSLDRERRHQVPFGSGALPAPEILRAAAATEILVTEFDDYDGDLGEAIRIARDRLQDLARR